jgi:hypothetical protein
MKVICHYRCHFSPFPQILKFCFLQIGKELEWRSRLHVSVLKSLEDMGTGEKFLNRTAMACAVRWRIDKWYLIKLQSFCKAKDTVNKAKRPPTDWERIFTNPKSIVTFLTWKFPSSRNSHISFTSVCKLLEVFLSLCIYNLFKHSHNL